jgi:hypothetical protein
VLDQIQAQLVAFTSPSSAPEQRAAAFTSLATFIRLLPPRNPGSVFQRLPIQSAVQQLSLPVLACPNLPSVATLQGLGCFELRTGAACASLIGAVRGCALWGATLEEIVPNGTKACQAFGLDDKADLEDFVFAFDNNVKPIVGQQVTLKQGAGAAARTRLDLLVQRANAGDCDLIAHSSDHGFAYSGGQFTRDDGARFTLSGLEQRVISRGPVTFTAVPPGEGRRSGIDRDEDGRLDAFERR